MRASFIFRQYLGAFCTARLKNLIKIKAIYSQLVIGQIVSGNSRNRNIPLLQSINNLQLPQEYRKKLTTIDQEVIKEARFQFIKAFDPLYGIQLPPSLITAQSRFIIAANQPGRLSFYPTNVVTTPLFQVLQKNLQSYMMDSKDIVVGKQGISKSINFLLYWHLSSLNTAFRFQYENEAKQLIQKQLLKKQGYKLLYVNFNNETMNIYDFAHFIADQCPQIKEQINNYVQDNLNLDELFLKIKRLYYKKKIKCFVVADQLNAMARIFREYNTKRYQLQKIIQSNQNTANKSFLPKQINLEFYSTLQKKVIKLFQIHQAIRNSIPRLYNSSKNIQYDLLGPPTQTGPFYITLDLLHHTPGQIFQIKYNQFDVRKTDNRQIYRFIWYNVAERMNKYLLPTQQQNQQIIKMKKSIQNIFLQSCDTLSEQNGFSSFITPYTINRSFKLKQLRQLEIIFRQFFGNKMENDQILKLNKQRIYRFVQNFYQEIQRVGFENVRSKSLRFLEEGGKQIVMSKSRVALFCMQYLRKNISTNSIPFQQIMEATGINVSSRLNLLYDKDIFNKDNKTGPLELAISRQQFQKLIPQWNMSILSRPNLSEMLQSFSLKCKGQFIEYAILNLLALNPQSILIFDNLLYKYKKIVNFKHLLGKNINIIERISPLLRQVNKNELEEYCLGCPQTSSKYQNTQQNGKQQVLQGKFFSPNNPSFDLLAIRINKQNQYEITSFDFTVDKQKKDLQQKFKKAQILLKQLDNYQHHEEFPNLGSPKQQIQIDQRQSKEKAQLQEGKQLQSQSKKQMILQNHCLIGDNQQVKRYIKNFMEILKQTQFSKLYEVLQRTRPKEKAKQFKPNFLRIVENSTDSQSAKKRILQFLYQQKEIQYLANYLHRIKSWQYIIMRPKQPNNQAPTVPKEITLKNKIKVSFRHLEVNEFSLNPTDMKANQYSHISLELKENLRNVWRA